MILLFTASTYVRIAIRQEYSVHTYLINSVKSSKSKSLTGLRCSSTKNQDCLFRDDRKPESVKSFSILIDSISHTRTHSCTHTHTQAFWYMKIWSTCAFGYKPYFKAFMAVLVLPVSNMICKRHVMCHKVVFTAKSFKKIVNN